MRIVKTLAVGLLGFAAYKAWKQRKARLQDDLAVGSLPDHGGTTPPHGDPRVPSVATDLSPAPAAAQSSRGFGEA